MFRCRLPLVILGLCTSALFAQDLENLQIHGFATQGFLFTTNNNYLTMKSSSGSLQWTEGALNVTAPLSERLRVGMQLHMYQMGELGGPNVLVDWALGDYKVSDQLGFRGGKVKVPMGLFNDSQDVDSLFVWTLLPQGCYPDDNRDFDLALLGGEVYGELDLGHKGSVGYRGYLGENRLDENGGYMLQLATYGFTFPTPPSGRIFGGDLRWNTPWHPLTVGSSLQYQRLDGEGPQGNVHLPPAFLQIYYTQWTKGRLEISGEYWRAQMTPMLLTQGLTMQISYDQRSWYPMVSYQLTKKLQVGTYYSHYVNQAADTSDPQNYSKDWVVSGRYNFNSNFYGKIEGHFLHGTGLGYYPQQNPDGLKPDSRMLAARIGFAF